MPLTPDQAAWAISALVFVCCTLVGLVWADVVRRLRELGEKLDKHIVDDITAHERLKAVEVELRISSERTKTVGDSLHNFKTEIRQALLDMHKWITEKVIELLKK